MAIPSSSNVSDSRARSKIQNPAYSAAMLAATSPARSPASRRAASPTIATVAAPMAHERSCWRNQSCWPSQAHTVSTTAQAGGRRASGRRVNALTNQ